MGPSTENMIPKVPNLSPFLKTCNQIKFVIAHVSNEEVLDIINSLESKSTGPSSIPLRMLSIIPDLIILPLAHIIKMSIVTGVYPDLLKIVKVIPIHGGSSHDINNYRPISLLSISDKIMEKMIHKKLYQHGFRKNNSTIHALMQITERIKTSIDSGKFGCGIFIDLRKAFATLNHDILLTKLEHYGIRDSMLKWFQSYLSGGKQFVSFNGVSSELLENNCGVPQGSVLGPLLFLIILMILQI